ncbi:hypothetical protein HPP92_029048 [Vanilla planifolia]|uniref:Uncharacterized protein n=1 Tax=Vanilla planifolia TaxID=51239 RepID=A0A835P386_VANPL|nr:hypothetical protein HPP92_029048 [Vanilla planifolia]KAG0446041.1 hypothetical protein HPP92_029037 [Vanilla planifolia]
MVEWKGSRFPKEQAATGSADRIILHFSYRVIAPAYTVGSVTGEINRHRTAKRRKDAGVARPREMAEGNCYSRYGRFEEELCC